MGDEQYLTYDGAQTLRKELERLKGPERDELAKRLRSAIQMGDLSENADYHAAKEHQAFLEGKIQELEYLLKNAVIIEEMDNHKGIVTIGSQVTIQEEDYPPETYFLVGQKEAEWDHNQHQQQGQSNNYKENQFASHKFALDLCCNKTSWS